MAYELTEINRLNYLRACNSGSQTETSRVFGLDAVFV